MFRHTTVTLITCGMLFSVVCVPTATGAVDMLWTVAGGIGYLPDASSDVAASPSVHGTACIRLTERTWLGVHGDYTSYRPVKADEAGSQWRVLALVQWEWRHPWMPSQMTSFAQFGIGFGRMAYTDALPPTESLRLWYPEQVTYGPAARLAGGFWWTVHPRIRANATVSFERLDTAINAISRKYPTMIGLTIGVSIQLPRGSSLTGFDEAITRE
ncbi:MAG TPA: hypothetical protein ENN56_01160 [Firmicutes bacterium]|nr:hypothetical protein [Bacillota bacterium]